MPTTTILLLYLILIFSLFFQTTTTGDDDESFISVLITQNGLDFVKNLLISKAISSLTPTPLSQIEKVVKIPVIGKVDIVVSDITIYGINVGSSHVVPSVTGVSIVASDVICGLTMKWHYSYATQLLPISISDTGNASIQVNGMEIGVILELDNEQGSMKISVMQRDCHINDISVDLDGGASWLYQGIMDAFKEEIVSAVEKVIIKKLKTGVAMLGSILQKLPKQITVDDVASLNVTFVNNPFLTDTSLGFEINGLFIEDNKRGIMRSSSSHNGNGNGGLQPPVHCSDPSTMIGIAIDQEVFTSALAVYYKAMFMHWLVDKVPEQSLLNTAGWRFIIPQLYKKYPNDDMNLNITLSDPPLVQISWQKIAATVYADIIIDVLEGHDTIPVACISLVIVGTSSVEITGNKLASNLKMDDFTMSLKWSKIGTLHMFVIQPVMWTLIETVFLPYVNARLGIGFPLPIIKGFMLENAEIITSDSRITVCSNVSYVNTSNRLVYAS